VSDRTGLAGRLASRFIVVNAEPSEPRGGGGAQGGLDEAAAWRLPGIAAPTRIETSFGQVPAHLVRKGDPVRVGDNRHLPVTAIREYRFDADFLAARPEAMPVVLRGKGARDDGSPEEARLSPAQPVMTGSGTADWDARLVPAGALGRPLDALDPDFSTLTYFQFEVGAAELISAGGLWVACARDEE